MNNKIISLTHKLLKYLDSCVVMNILIEITLQLFCMVLFNSNFITVLSSSSSQTTYCSVCSSYFSLRRPCFCSKAILTFLFLPSTLFFQFFPFWFLVETEIWIIGCFSQHLGHVTLLIHMFCLGAILDFSQHVSPAADSRSVKST